MIRNFADGIKFFPAAAVCLGALLILFYGLRHLPNFIKSANIQLEHPETYRFTVYDSLLKKYVRDGLVDYTALKKDKDLPEAVSALESIAADNLKGEKQRACFWINTFNLLTLKVICDHYPVTSTDQLSQYWSQAGFMVGGEQTSVSRVYGRVMHELEDRRIAPNCVFLISRGSLGYPPLTGHAITPETMETDAKVAVYQFVNNEHNAFYDEEKLVFLLSPVFKRYEKILRRSRMDPHKFAVLHMNTNNPPDVTNMMITKTYFGKINPMLNDLALTTTTPLKEGE